MPIIAPRPRQQLVMDRYHPQPATMLLRGWDLTSATMHMQVKLYPDSDYVLIDLPRTASMTATGVRLINVVAGTDGRPWSTVAMQITAASMATLPPTTQASAAPFAEPGDDAQLAWDLVGTPPGLWSTVIAAGDLIVKAGVTR